LAALAGEIDSAVVVWALAAAQDIIINKAAHREKRGFLPWIARPRVSPFLELSNSLLPLPKVCGRSIASERNAARRGRCKNEYLEAATRAPGEFHVVWAQDNTNRQKRSDTALRETFMDAGISEPFGLCKQTGMRLPGRALRVVPERCLSLQWPLVFVTC
jgi:hypothetical protein